MSHLAASPRPQPLRVLLPVHPEPPKRSVPYLVAPVVQAGFPSPAADYLEETLDFNDLLVRNPPATFCYRCGNESLADLGIRANDIVVVDRSVTVLRGHIVVTHVDGDFFVKVLGRFEGRLALISFNEARAAEFPPIILDKCHEFEIYGCVTGLVRDLRAGPAYRSR